MSEARRREHEPTHLHFERKMSDAEALMWNVEKDPWLNPSGATVTIMDRHIDTGSFRRRLARAVATIPRLHQRVVPGLGRLSPPVWATDPEFDLDFHVRHVSLPSPGTRRQLYDLVALLYSDPFDRTRPPWQFVVIDGLEGGQGALLMKLHHSISDGNGLVRLSEAYMELRRDAPPPPEVDLAAVIADALEAEKGAQGEDGDLADVLENPGDFMSSAGRSLGHVVRRQLGIARRAAGEALMWTADPRRAVESGEEAVETLRSMYDQLTGGSSEVTGGSPLWKNRSRGRHLESLRVPLADAKAAGHALGGSVNDVFVTGAVMGALDYHAAHGTEVEALNISFVVSTRTDDAAGGNSFTPTRIQVPGGSMDVKHRFASTRDLMTAARAEVHGSGALAGLAGVANLLPTSVITRFARAQAAKMDFATSNLRAAPFTTYISGAKVLDSATMGPVAGTAFNLTTISYDGSLDMGLFSDPAAVTDPDALRDHMRAAYQQLLRAGGVKTPRRTAARR